MSKAEEPRLCIVCGKKREKECSHIDCPHRRQVMRDPFLSQAYEGLHSAGTYKRKSANYPED